MPKKMSKIIPIDDIITVNSQPKNLKDVNCLILYYKENSKNSKKPQKIKEFKMVVASAFSKVTIIERLKELNRKKYDFIHRKNDNEIFPQNFLKMENFSSKKINKGILNIFYLFYFKNLNFFF